MKKVKRSLWNEERGQFTYVILFIIIFALLLFAFAIVIPIMQAVVVGFWSINSNTLMPVIQDQINTISIDTNASTAMQGALDSQSGMQSTTFELFSVLVTYSGIITIVVVFFAWLLIGRRNVEAGGLA